MGGVLPAYAGMIQPGAGPRPAPDGAPRVCGDDPFDDRYGGREHHVLPAYAGMIPRRSTRKPGPRRAPRVCGDDPSPS